MDNYTTLSQHPSARLLAIDVTPPNSSHEPRRSENVDVFLETDRLILRRFTEDDVDNLSALDSDPAVMRYITGGSSTPREEIAGDRIPAYLAYYERFAGYGFWAAIEKSTGDFLRWFHLRPYKDDAP